MTYYRCALTRWLAGTIVGILTLSLQGSVHAATATPYFTNLVSELQARSTALTGVTSKTAKDQKKAIDAALKSIATAHGLALTDDLKLASTVAKGLAKPFAAEFVANGTPIPPGTKAFGGLVSTLVSNLADEVTADLDDIDSVISTLPDGKTKTALTKSATATHLKLTAALGMTPIASEASALATVETGIMSLSKTVLKSATSGSSKGNMTATVNGQPFSATTMNGIYVYATGEFSVNGSIPGGALKGITVTAFNVTGPGTYPLTGATFYEELATKSIWGDNCVGTLVITALDLATGTASGTFSFTADQTSPMGSSGHVTVTAGTFSVSKITKVGTAGSSGGGSSGGGSGGGGGGNSMTATITGQPNFSTTTLIKTFFTFNNIWSVSIGGLKVGVPSYSLSISADNVTGPGTYPISSSSSYAAGQDSYNSSISGTVTFTAIDFTAQTASGTFSYTAAKWGGGGSITATGSFTAVK